MTAVTRPALRYHGGQWSGGLAEWHDGETVCLSVAFTWRLDEAAARAVFYKALGKRVLAGGPALFLPKMRHELHDLAEIGTTMPDAIARHNPMATIASRGCPVGCWFCIVPAMEGREFTLLPDFPVRPVLCDNNLSALPDDYQRHIIERYEAEGVPLLDANSGFEPRTFTDLTFARWSAVLRGPWRFAYDETAERADVFRVMQILRGLPPKKKRVYVLIGNEPFEACMARIREVIEWGGEPHVQPYMKLNALQRRPHARAEWEEVARQRGVKAADDSTPGEQLLRDVARWANGFVWKTAAFDDYERSLKSSAALQRSRGGLFAEVSAA